MNKKDLINDLYNKRSDFKDPDQAETMSNLLDTVSSDIYSESQRFVFELIQNADDAAKHDDNEVHFEFHNESLIVSHNGQPFSLDDIQALTSAGSSTKKDDITKTGYKGIGFKSVFGKSERVSIFSDGFQFRFDKLKHKTLLPWQIIPIWTELSDLDNLGKEVTDSLSENTYAVSTVIEIENVESLQNDLEHLLSNGQILLFLRNVSKISVSKNGNEIYSIDKIAVNTDSYFNEINLVKNGDKISSWITKNFSEIPVPLETRNALKHDRNTPKKLKNAMLTDLSFAAKVENGKLKALKDNESLIFTYLPTKVSDFKFPFLVNGSFLTNAAREGIHEDKIWNQWLFGLIAEKALDWLVSLSASKYKFQILHLLPLKFNSYQNELKTHFNNSFIKHCANKKFIVTNIETTCKLSEIILDKTDLSNQFFIDKKSITDFIKAERKLSFSDNCFVNRKVECSNKLQSIGAEIFELENLETFFISQHFTNRHKVSDNYNLIKYFKEKSENDAQGIWFQTLKTLPFIYDDRTSLSNPSNGICFPTGINTTELGSIPIIHPDVFDEIMNNEPMYHWLKKLGIQKPSEKAYVNNVIIPNIKTPNYINTENFIEITHYLFRLFMEKELDEKILESLRELKLKIKGSTACFIEAEQCFLSKEFRPKLELEGIIEGLNFISEDYLSCHDNVLEWNLFFKALKAKDAVEVETINQNNTLGTLRLLTDSNWVEESRVTASKKGGFGFGEHNVISSVKLPSFVNLVSSNFDYAKLFWENIISNQNNISELIGTASLYYGVGNGHNSYSSSVENYFPWFIRNKECIPTTTKEILKPENVFINKKEIVEIVGEHLPVFDFKARVPNEWLQLLEFKNNLVLVDYLSILSKMANLSGNKKSNNTSLLKRIGLIYNKLTSLIPNMSESEQLSVSDWAVNNKLLSSSGIFEPATKLKWITVDGFSTESDKLKIINIPKNSESNLQDFKVLISLFKVQTIDKFIPMFEDQFSEKSLKNKLESIIPYYVALIEKKNFKSSDEEFKRIYKILNLTDFYTVSEIKLSFNYQSEIFDGPSFTVYKSDHKFYFKGKWTNERTLLSLIKEIANLLDVSGLNEELRFLLLESDINEIKEWLIEQGISLSSIKSVQKFSTKVHDNTDNAGGKTYLPEECESDITSTLEPDHSDDDCNKSFISNENDDSLTLPLIPEIFKPLMTPNDIDLTKISAKHKQFDSSGSRAEVNYSKIESQEVREDVGRWCEEFVFEYLMKHKEHSTKVIWENKDTESGKPYDFKIIENGAEKFIDVKGTPSENKDVIYLSPNEWVLMFDKGENYSIYRVYNAGKSARIEIIENPSRLLQQGKIFPNPITIQV